MSQQNVELIQRTMAYFAETGNPMLEILDPDVEVYDHDIPDAGTYRGTAGFEQWLADWTAAWEEFAMQPEEWIDAGDKVVIILLMTAKGRGSGVEVTRRDGMVWTLRDGKVIRLDYFNTEEQARAAAGLA